MIVRRQEREEVHQWIIEQWNFLLCTGLRLGTGTCVTQIHTHIHTRKTEELQVLMSNSFQRVMRSRHVQGRCTKLNVSWLAGYGSMDGSCGASYTQDTHTPVQTDPDRSAQRGTNESQKKTPGKSGVHIGCACILTHVGEEEKRKTLAYVNVQMYSIWTCVTHDLICKARDLVSSFWG